MSTRISLQGIHKSFRSAPNVLRGVDLGIPSGEVFALLGPNGSGKTTLVRILCTLLLPDAGEVRIDDCDALRDPIDARRKLGCSLDSERSFFLRLSAIENLRFFAALHGFSRSEAARRSSDLIEMFDLGDAAKKSVQEFSSGMKQKLSLARAMLSDPPVLILDEPTRGLDPLASAEFRTRVYELARTGKTILLVTHSVEEASELADAAGVLWNGTLTPLAGDWKSNLAVRYAAVVGADARGHA